MNDTQFIATCVTLVACLGIVVGAVVYLFTHMVGEDE